MPSSLSICPWPSSKFMILAFPMLTLSRMLKRYRSHRNGRMCQSILLMILRYSAESLHWSPNSDDTEDLNDLGDTIISSSTSDDEKRRACFSRVTARDIIVEQWDGHEGKRGIDRCVNVSLLITITFNKSALACSPLTKAAIGAARIFNF